MDPSERARFFSFVDFLYFVIKFFSNFVCNCFVSHDMDSRKHDSSPEIFTHMESEVTW